MNEATVLITKLLEHYDAVEHLHHAIQIIGILLVLLLIQTSRAAFHRGKRESLEAVMREMEERISSHCEEITWHRDHAEDLEARLFKEPLPERRQDEALTTTDEDAF